MERVQSEKNQGPSTQPYGTPRIKDQVEENEHTKEIEAGGTWEEFGGKFRVTVA